MERGELVFDCGIAQSRILGWLDDELGLTRDGDERIFEHAGACCRITAEPLEPRALGKVELERTLLSAAGGQTALDEFERIFTLRFMSAGG